ncbi:MAG: hypothetical protein A2V65_01480 [Deltaproteobacteria bacterium RBG_13_49_15]|nr:MAG: hypothetical protein A2V65_01480 [Deltaproteobacteria bacterium RBG_13_49_15]
MNRYGFTIPCFWYVATAILVFGCAAPVKRVIVEKPQESLLRLKAIEYEGSGKLNTALQLWQSLSHYAPNDMESKNKAAQLKMEIQKKVNQHLSKGRTYYYYSSMRDARREFLKVLFYDSENKEALDYLKNRLHGDDLIVYEVKPGDTLEEIARKAYQDPQKGFVVAKYNDLKSESALESGRVLKLPVIEVVASDAASRSTQESQKTSKSGAPFQKQPPQKIPEESQVLTAMVTDYSKGLRTGMTLSDAKRLFDKKRYQETIAIAEEILEQDDDNQTAKNLINASYYQMGKGMVESKNYKEAIKYFSRVDPEYLDVGRLKSDVEVKLSDVHYIEGVKYFVNEKLENAISEWEMTLAFNPEHQKAKADIENARNIIKKLKEIK